MLPIAILSSDAQTIRSLEQWFDLNLKLREKTPVWSNDPHLGAVVFHSLYTCFLSQKLGALQQTFLGKTPTCPVLCCQSVLGVVC